MPENVTKLGKGKIVPTPDYVNAALENKPSVVFEMNDELKDMISVESFFKAFAKDPEICACDAKVLKKYISRKIEVNKDGKKQTIKYGSSVRNECLKAIRLAMKVSTYHQGYDDFAMAIAQQIKKNKVFDKYKTKDKMATKLATVVNSLIKNQDVRIYAMPVEVWKLNNYKPLYLAVKESVKKESQISSILEFIPFDLLPNKVTKKVLATAIKKDPKVWLKLNQYNLGKFKNDDYILYVTYNSCKANKCSEIVLQYFTAEQKKNAEKKLQGVLKRKETQMKKANAKLLDSTKLTAEKPEKQETKTNDDEKVL